jgi:hypothetical protein
MEAPAPVSNAASSSLTPLKEEIVLKGKLAYILGSLAIVVGTGVGYRVVTGECPVGALCNAINGKPTTQVVAAKPANSN